MFPIFTPANQWKKETEKKAQHKLSQKKVHCRVGSMKKSKNKAHPIQSPRNSHNHQHHPPKSLGLRVEKSFNSTKIYQHFPVIKPPDKELESESNGKGPPETQPKIGAFSRN